MGTATATHGFVGHALAKALHEQGREALPAIAQQMNQLDLLDSFLRVQDEEVNPSFIHSALCAMSLPSRKPTDENAPIIREDGRYALAIVPRPVLVEENGRSILKTLGVPFGCYPRVILIYLLSEAVKKQQRDVYLGRNFTDFMRRMGYTTTSYGPNGMVTRMKEQLDRLLACEWQIRWDGQDGDENAFGVRNVKISNEYAGVDGAQKFSREIRLSETFYQHLVDHAVPLNELAIRELKNSPVALDLYCYLAFRLTRISGSGPIYLSWDQLARHLGSTADTRRFRQTVREAMQAVSAVYPNANVDMSGHKVMLYASPAPLERKLVGAHLRLVGGSAAERTQTARPARTRRHADAPGAQPALPFQDETASARDSAVRTAKSAVEAVPLVKFPTGSLRYGDDAKPFLALGQSRGSPWDVDMIADAFRAGFKGIDKLRAQAEWLRLWSAFIDSYVKTRKPGE